MPAVAQWLSVSQPHLGLTDANEWKRARHYLGLTDAEAERLFAEPRQAEHYDHCWPVKFNRAYLSAKTAKQKASVVVARIDHFIKTKGRE